MKQCSTFNTYADDQNLGLILTDTHCVFISRSTDLHAQAGEFMGVPGIGLNLRTGVIVNFFDPLNETELSIGMGTVEPLIITAISTTGVLSAPISVVGDQQVRIVAKDIGLPDIKTILLLPDGQEAILFSICGETNVMAFAKRILESKGEKYEVERPGTYEGTHFYEYDGKLLWSNGPLGEPCGTSKWFSTVKKTGDAYKETGICEFSGMKKYWINLV